VHSIATITSANYRETVIDGIEDAVPQQGGLRPHELVRRPAGAPFTPKTMEKPRNANATELVRDGIVGPQLQRTAADAPRPKRVYLETYVRRRDRT
jgi:hypothetical protein